jgi:hypothetical protein
MNLIALHSFPEMHRLVYSEICLAIAPDDAISITQIPGQLHLFMCNLRILYVSFRGKKLFWL